MGQALQKLGEVFLAVEVVTAFRRMVHIPGDLLQFIKGRQEVRRLAQGRNQALDHLLAGQSLDRIDGRGQAGGKKQRADLGGRFLAGLQVDDLGVGGLLRVPEILGDDIAHPGNLGQLVAHFGDRRDQSAAGR